MLPLKNRIKKKKDFEKLFQEGSSYLGRFFILKTLKNEFSFPRFAFIVSIKVDKSAVKRNKIRRRLRESVRPLLPFIKKNTDVVFIAKKEIKEKDFNMIKEEVNKAFKKIKLT
jgi:ribonuclease P protein component